MSKKTVIILLMLVVVIAASVTLSRWMSARKASSSPETPIATAFQSLVFESIVTVKISQGEASVAVLRGDAGMWSVNGKRVDHEQVKTAIEALKGVGFTGPVSRSPENFDKLGVGSSGTVVEAGSLKFTIGKDGPTYGSTYTRLDGSNDTYLADKNLTQYFAASEDSWRSRVVVDIEPMRAVKVEYRKGGKITKTYKQEGGSWYTVIGGTSTTTDAGLVEGVMSAVHPLSASGFVSEEADIAVFNKEKGKGSAMEFFGGDESAIASLAFVKRETEWWVQAEGDSQIYRIPQYTIDALKME